MSALSMRGRLAALAALALSATGLVVAAPAAAATTITVTSTADADANDACSTPSVVVTATPVTLRNALCVAGNLGGTTTIEVPQGTYPLTSGALELRGGAGTDVTLSASGGRATIVGDGSSQLLAIDPGLTGGISVEIVGFGFEGGRDSVYGGGAIIGGAAGAPADTLIVRDSVFRDNASLSGTAGPGGAIQFIGGDLTITGSTFRDNDAGTSSGGAVYYEARMPGDDLVVSGSTFTGNRVRSESGIEAGGGAIAYSTNGVGSVEITRSLFDRNIADGTGGPAVGGAIHQVQGPAVVSGSVFTANSATGGAAGGGAIHATAGALSARFSSFAGNTGAAAVRSDPGAAATVTHDWWGCVSGPGTPGCDSVALSTGSATPFLTLTASSGDPTLTTGETTTVTASLLTDSAGDPVDPASLSAFDGRLVGWSGAAPAGSSVAPSTSVMSGGVATATFTAGSTPGVGGVTAALGGASVTLPLTVAQDAVFTSPGTAGAVVGQAFSFTVTATGFPEPTVSLVSGSLPPGLAVSPTGSTATISGVPLEGSGGSYPLVFAADNGATRVQQTVTIEVGAVPAFTGPVTATVAEGEAVDVVVSASGAPAPSLSAQGELPAGLSLHDNGDGTAQLSGVPSVSPGTHAFTLVAVNAVGSTSAEFTLTITSQPRFESADSATFTAGAAGVFPVIVAPGYPATGPVTISADAPPWLSLSGPQGAQQLVGTPPAGSGGTMAFTLSVDGVDGPVTQPFTLTVHEAPVVTLQPQAASVLVGTDAVFTASASGHPTPSVQWERRVDGLWTPISGATADTLTLHAAIDDDGALVRAVFTNAAGAVATEPATLTVGEPPVLDPVPEVRVLAGAPVIVHLVSTGTPVSALTAAELPAWLSFTDAGDGTAELSGTPALADAGTVRVAVTATNGFGTAQTTVRIVISAEVPLPDALPSSSDGSLGGVPATVTRGQRLQVTGDGFLPGATVALGIYSTPTALATAVAGDDGSFSATVTVPADQSLGAHTIAASGIGDDGAARLLASGTTVQATGSTGGGSTGGGSTGGGSTGGGSTGGGSTGGAQTGGAAEVPSASTVDQLGATGLDATATIALMAVAVLAVLGGLVLVLRGIRRRR
ncbi:putative Ig domain-containing protein [Microbacterium sp. XT11]|uniref:putative Ig domain-containing protein n=1 Tax=Microbacterium sp. XT11 TaxID=367477 RepID=UPI0008327D29|nr:putative Ig domain-containing protein [Microbacterium sp. XT11]